MNEMIILAQTNTWSSCSCTISIKFTARKEHICDLNACKEFKLPYTQKMRSFFLLFRWLDEIALMESFNCNDDNKAPKPSFQSTCTRELHYDCLNSNRVH